MCGRGRKLLDKVITTRRCENPAEVDPAAYVPREVALAWEIPEGWRVNRFKKINGWIYLK